LVEDVWTLDGVAGVLEGPLAQPGFPIDAYPTNCALSAYFDANTTHPGRESRG
jgi:hypothetical protein